ncbi:hypothetical protein DAEQUDRAFT_720426 [Daedalea quercina L-15889]|uniref:C2H2-type domain-containing protein n=1 Tax=Daedalea quercina L-15889 TaxID=1314783 RepID=A0A165U1P3_9APHY|nr:hypothetical protein DAEQUDRAFT_720426 [Daedalea quercina L-15889]
MHPNSQNLEILAKGASLERERRTHPTLACTANNVHAASNIGRYCIPPHDDHHTQRTASVHPRALPSPPTRLPSLREMTRDAPPIETRRVSTEPVSDGQEQNSQGRVRLSVYESPRATYTWPRFDPTLVSLTKEKPVIYVTYKRGTDASHGDEKASTCSSSATGLSEPASLYAKDVNGRKRSSSIESDCASNAGSLFKQARFSYHHRPQHNHDHPSRSTTSSPTVSNGPATVQLGRELHASFQGLGIRGEGGEKGALSGTSRQPTETATSTPTEPPSAPTDRGKQSRTKPVRRPICALRSDDEWLQYTKPFKAPGPGGFRGLRCIWHEPKKGDEGSFVRCTYIQKRHLVKRHICSKHLGIRPWECRVCGKTFAQLSNLETHENTHTGERPHECPFCDERFKDPARQYRHKKDVHGYVTARERKMISEVYGTSDPELSDSDARETDEDSDAYYGSVNAPRVQRASS